MLPVMIRLRRTRKWLAWLLAFVVLFGALLPSASAMPRGGEGETWLEVCTVNGIERIALDADSSPEKSAHSEQPCEWCRLHGGLPAIPSDVAAPDVPRERGTATFVPFPAVLPAHSGDWPPANPRAPPAHI
jgi:hypothetical protein